MNKQLVDMFSDKTVAIAGYGVEGKAAYQFLQLVDDCTVIIIDQNPDLETPAEAQVQLGEDWLAKLDSYDIVLRSSGLHPAKLGGARKVTTSTELLLEFYGSQTIGVTGTKGKSTTTSLLAAILTAAGQQVELVGNIGRSTWEILSGQIDIETVVVAELSSFQLSDVRHSPHAAVMLPVVSDHLDWHGDQQHYLDSKLNLVRYQSSDDWAVTSSMTAAELNIDDITTSNIVITDDTVKQDEDRLIIDAGSIDLASVLLPGQHNLDNIAAALTAAVCWLKEREVGIYSNWEHICRAIYDFAPLKYHLQSLGEVSGHEVINDSYSSTPVSTVAALWSVDGPKTLIFGGQSRGLELEPTLTVFDEAEVEVVVVVGADDEYCRMVTALISSHADATVDTVGEQNMDTIFNRALDISSERTTILFSPGHPSFDMYKDFNQRGKLFTEAVERARGSNA